MAKFKKPVLIASLVILTIYLLLIYGYMKDSYCWIGGLQYEVQVVGIGNEIDPGHDVPKNNCWETFLGINYMLLTLPKEIMKDTYKLMNSDTSRSNTPVKQAY